MLSTALPIIDKITERTLMNGFNRKLLIPITTFALLQAPLGYAETILSNVDQVKSGTNIFRSNVWSAYQLDIGTEGNIDGIVLDVDENSGNGFSQLPGTKVRFYQDNAGSIGSPLMTGTTTDSDGAFIQFSHHDGDNAYFSGSSIDIDNEGTYWVAFTSESGANVDFHTTNSNQTTGLSAWKVTGKSGYVNAGTYTGYTAVFSILGLPSKTVKILDTSSQIAYLTAANEGLSYHLDNKHNTNVIDWSLNQDQVSAALLSNDVSAKDSKYSSLGLFDVGPRYNWYYSKSLFPTHSSMTSNLTSLLQLTDEIGKLAKPAANVVNVRASSSNAGWVAENVLDPTHRTYWMSNVNSGVPEWVELEYDRAFAAKNVTIVLNNGRQGSYPEIQGSNDGVTWTSLSTFNAFDYPNDDQNFRHINFNIDNNQAYSHYRYHSDPTVYVLLNFIQFNEQLPEGKPVVVSQKASSTTEPWKASNVVDATEGSYWMSAVNAPEAQWIELGYNRAFTATKANIVLNNGRQGSSPRLQGSNNGRDWVDVATFNAFDYPNDARNFRHIEFSFTNDQAFNRYRYYSDPTVYLLLEYLELSYDVNSQ